MGRVFATLQKNCCLGASSRSTLLKLKTSLANSRNKIQCQLQHFKTMPNEKQSCGVEPINMHQEIDNTQ